VLCLDFVAVLERLGVSGKMAIQDYGERPGALKGFTVEFVDAEGPLSVRPFGELDISTAPILRERLEHLGRTIGADVLMDLDHLTFLDSSGISLVVTICKRVRANGGTFSVTCSVPTIRRVLEIAGLLEYLQAH
jgi:anti-sigma B factor antagonist